MPTPDPAPSEPYAKHRPFPAPVKRKVLLSGSGSDKEVWHVELDLDGAGFAYEPGDHVVLLPRNAPDVVASVASACRLDLAQRVLVKDAGETTLGEAMAAHLDITGLTPAVIGRYNALARSDELARLLMFPNVLVTAHQAFLTHEALSDISRVTVRNIMALAEERPFEKGTTLEGQ